LSVAQLQVSDSAHGRAVNGRLRRGTRRAAAASMFGFFSTRLGCVGSIIVSIVGSLLLMLVLRGCSSAGHVG
jgi:hypothetical protein